MPQTEVNTVATPTPFSVQKKASMMTASEIVRDQINKSSLMMQRENSSIVTKM